MVSVFEFVDQNNAAVGVHDVQKTIQVLTAGGTIDKVYFDANSSFQVGEPQVSAIFKEANLAVPFVVESVLRKDSLDLTDDDRELIFQKVLSCPYDRIIITHGTDTMATTAKYLSERIKTKTIVFTGSMEPAKIKSSDAVFNVASALTAVQLLTPGSYICMNGQVFHADNVQKNHSVKRFETIDENKPAPGETDTNHKNKMH